MEPFLIPLPVETGSHILSSWVDPVHTVCSRVQTMVWLPMVRIFKCAQMSVHAIAS